MRTTLTLDDDSVPFRVQAKARGFRAGVDIEHLIRLNDELETADFQRELLMRSSVVEAALCDR